jgi:hypothetical protein
MRFRFRSALLVLVAVAAFAGSAAASASAHEFVASKTGALTYAPGNAHFKVGEASVEFNCKKPALTGTGTVTELKRKTLTVKVTYPRCEFLSGLDWALAPFTAEWEVNAEGTVKLLKTVALEVSEPPAGCTWNLTPSAGEESTATFTNSGPVKTINIVRSAKHMKEEPLHAGGECGANSEAGTWKETLTLGVEGGTLQWK